MVSTGVFSKLRKLKFATDGTDKYSVVTENFHDAFIKEVTVVLERCCNKYTSPGSKKYTKDRLKKEILTTCDYVFNRVIDFYMADWMHTSLLLPDHDNRAQIVDKENIIKKLQTTVRKLIICY
jgi:hypothetical protein